jgi:hypothetical protein
MHFFSLFGPTFNISSSTPNRSSSISGTTNSQTQSTTHEENNNTLPNTIPNEVQSILQSILPSLIPSSQSNNNITPSLSNNHSNTTNQLQNPNNSIVMVYEDLTQQQGLSLTEIHQVSELVLNESSSDEEEPKICSICQQNLEWNIIIRKINGCNHEYHVNCIDRWLVDHSNCPTCRRELILQDNNNLQRSFSQNGLSSYQFRIPRNT